MKDEILGGLKSAMSRGDSLQQAMQSFYNAGYDKKDIEEAARALHSQLHQEQIKKTQETQEPLKQVKKSQEPVKVQQPISSKTQKQVMPPQKTIQKVSDYDSVNQKEKNPRKKMIIFIASLLTILLVILAGIFFFRENLLGLFNRFFG